MADQKLNLIISATDKASGTLKGITGALGGLGKFAMGAAVAGIGAAVTGVTALAGGIGILAKEAAMLGPVTDAFDAINKSIGKNSDEMLSSLSNASNGLITNTELMKTFNKAAQLVNKDFASKLPDAMDYLGKVAGATGQDLDYLLDSLVTGVGRLSPMILDNLGIQVDLVAAQEAYALSIGKSASELTKAEQQTALMNQVMEKLATNTEGMTAISDPFKQLAVTFTNVKDTVAQAVGPVILPLIQRLADGISKFVKSDEFNAWLEKAVKFLEEKFVPFLVKAADFLMNELPPAIATVVEWLKENLVPAMQTVGEWIATKFLPAVAKIVAFLQANVFPVLAALGRVIGIVLVKNFQALVGLWQNVLLPALTAIWTFIKDKLNISFGDTGTIVERLVKLFTMWGDNLEKLKLPDWLTPGSPTPLELGLIGITDAVDKLSNLSLPRLGASFGGMQMAGAPAGGPMMGGGRMGGGSTNVTVVYSPTLSLANREELETRLGPVIRNALRRG